MEGNELLLTVVFVAAVTVIFSLISLRQKKASWSGTLAKKTWKEDEEGGRTVYRLIFDTNRGRKTVTVLSKAEYDRWEVGDRGEKTSGEYFPQKAG